MGPYVTIDWDSPEGNYMEMRGLLKDRFTRKNPSLGSPWNP